MIKGEVNYDAGRKASSFKPDDIEIGYLPHVGTRFCITIKQRYRYCHALFEQLVMTHTKLHQMFDQPPDSLAAQQLIVDSPNSDILIGKPALLYEYSFLTENLVYQMRRTIDSFIQLAMLIDMPHEEISSSKITVSGLDGLLSSGGEKKQVFRRLLGSNSLREADETNFLSVMNDLFNAMKHHWPHEDVHDLFCVDWPVIRSFYAQYNDTSKGVIFHNHNAFHIMMGYQDMMGKFAVNISSEYSNTQE